MNIKELFEGVEPELPGAPAGIQIMTPQQFIAKSAQGEEPEPEEEVQGVAEDYDDFDDEDEESGLRSGGYVRDKEDSSGEVFIMRGDPYDRRVQITDRNGSGWNISPSRLVAVDDSDPAIARYFGKGVAEATALPASTRELKGQELTDYLDRIRNQEKKKTDKYNLPYVHRSSVVGYYNAEGKKYNTDAIKEGLKERPKSLLKKNEKMKHSDGEQEQFFNIGFAALVGIALDENTNELIVVNTCPGAGSCKVDCFAMKGGKVQFAGPWLSDGRILTYLLNHPDEFFNQLTEEIRKEESKGKKGGYSVSIRWHDAGDFFSPEYMDMAFDLANSLPDVKFYAYTKVAKAAMATKPSNFIINWSEGASTGQEKQIKRNDPNLDKTKNSRIVPSSLFYDLLVKDEKKNLIKGPEGQWQVIPDELPELKQRLADKYNISKNSILSYDEWNTKGKNNKSMKWNVIVAPGEPDLTANDTGVLGTLLLKH